MRLERAILHRAPGISGELRIEALSPGLNIVLGPNASGKSTFCRSVRASLWPKDVPNRGLEVVLQWRGAHNDTFESHLDRGQVAWRSPSRADSFGGPVLPGREAALAYELSVRELISFGHGADASIAELIARELSGGFDLAALRAALDARESPHRTRKREFEEAAKKLSKVEQEHESLAESERGLQALSEAVARGEDARRMLEPLENALKLVDAREIQKRLEAASTTFPDALERLHSSDVDQLDEQLGRRQTAEQQLESNTRERTELEATQAAIRLPHGALDPDTAELWRERVGQLADLEKDLDRSQTTVAGNTARKDAARRELSSQTTSDAWLEPKALHRLEQSLGETLGLEGQCASRRRELQQPLAEAGEQTVSAQTLTEAVSHLRSWLAAEPLASSSSAAPNAGLVSAFLGGAGALAFAGGLLLDNGIVVAAGASLLGAGLALFLGTRWASRAAEKAAAASVGGRERAQTAFSRTGVLAPKSWQEPDVRHHLHDLERERDEAVLADRERVRQREARKLAEAELARVEAELEAKRGEQRALALELGLEPSVFGLELLEIARRLTDLREATRETEAAKAEFAEQKKKAQTQRASLTEFFSGHALSAPADATEAKSGLQTLTRRSEQQRQAEQKLADLALARTALEKDGRDAETRIQALLAKTGQPEAEREDLVALTGRLADYQHHKTELALARRRVGELEQLVSPHPEFARLEPEELLRRRDEAARLTAEWKEKVQERERLKAELDAAGKHGTLEDTIADCKQSEALLREDFERVLENRAGLWLLDHIGRRSESEHIPPVLDRAKNWFARFTHHRFELEVSRTGDARLSARDTVLNEPRTLEELSDGTRVQLLLAARMAFIAHAETEESLPFFLDEALSTTDDRRFEAIAQSLLDVSVTGRQIFYLSANPADAEIWLRLAEARGLPAPKVIELGPSESTGRPAATRLLPKNRVEVPAPGAMSSQEYAQHLGVREVEPEAPVSSWHLYYVALEELTALQAALEHGVGTIGQWRQFRDTPLLGATALDPSVVRAIDARINVAESTHRLARIGRGRSVTVAVLSESGALSEAMEAQTSELFAGQTLDPERVESLLTEHLKGFGAKRGERLREHLVAEGYLDERPTLNIDELVAGVSEELERELREGALPSQSLPGLVRWYAEMSGWTPALPVSYSA